MVHSTKTKLETKKILDIGKYRLRARAGWYSVLIGESNVAIDPAIGGYGVEDIYLGEFSPPSQSLSTVTPRCGHPWRLTPTRHYVKPVSMRSLSLRLSLPVRPAGG